MKPDISVIIPIYNAENYLEKSIKSILNQTFSNLEVILVDDGSRDGSKKICEKFMKEDYRVRYIYKENGGASSAKNKGIEIAQGKYIEFVDADDFLDIDYIENLFHGIKQEEVDICVGNIAFCKKEENSFYKKKLNILSGVFSVQEWLKFYSEYMPKAIIGASWNKLFKKNIIDKENIRFDEKLKNNEDTQFNYLYLEKCKKIYVSATPYYNYVDWGEKSLSKGYIENIFDVYLSTYKKSIEFLKSFEMYEYNKEFSKKYFIGLVIGAINNIVVLAPDNILEKNKKIKNIIFNREVQEAACDLRYDDIKRKIFLLLIRKRKVTLLHILFMLNKILKNFL